ncbi:unnamed protein product [Diamesa tonsa]
MEIFHSIRFDEITDEDFKALTIEIDESSEVYEIFQLIFHSKKKNKIPNEFSNIIKSYGFPTNRSVEYSLVHFDKTDHLEMICTMPLSKISPEWEKRCNINIGGRILEKWSFVHENKKREAGNVDLRLDIMDIFHSIQFDEITEEDFIALIINIDEKSNVYEIFQLIFYPIKKNKTSNEFTNMMKSYGFPTNRGVEYSLVQLNKTDHLEMVCTMPLSKTSPEWEKRCNTNIGGRILEKWSIVYENKSREAGNVKLRLNIMEIFNSIRFDDLTEEDFECLTICIDESSEVYEIFQKIFHSKKKDNTANEFTEMIKSYEFPTIRGVEYAIVEFEKTEHLEIICTMPLSKTSPEWEKRCIFNIGGCVQEKWSIVYKNKKREAGNVNLRLEIMNIFHSIRFDEITEEDFKALTIEIDESSDVYELFQLIFKSVKKNETTNEFKEMIKSYRFPTNRGVEYSLVQLNKTEHLEMVCTMPLSEKSPEWEKRRTINIGGRILEKWSIVYKNTLKYDPNLDYWLKIEEMPVILYEYSAVALDGTLLISGGKRSKDSESTKDFWMFSLASNAWTQLPDMNYDRSNHVMLRKKSIIYFIGGAAEIDAVKNVEYFDMFTQSFELITSTGTKRFEDNQVVFNNQYFIKNEHKQTVTSSLELDVYKLMCRSFRDNDIKKFMYDSIYMYKT